MATAKAEKTVKVFVRSAGAPLLHLFTNVWFTADPKKVEMDGFLQAQIDAGKLVVVTSDD
jgi:hypothetical protein